MPDWKEKGLTDRPGGATLLHTTQCSPPAPAVGLSNLGREEGIWGGETADGTTHSRPSSSKCCWSWCQSPPNIRRAPSNTGKLAPAARRRGLFFFFFGQAHQQTSHSLLFSFCRDVSPKSDVVRRRGTCPREEECYCCAIVDAAQVNCENFFQLSQCLAQSLRPGEVYVSSDRSSLPLVQFFKFSLSLCPCVSCRWTLPEL